MNLSFAEKIAALNIKVDSPTFDRFLAYAELLHQWNQAYNLTGAKTLNDILVHILDSLTIASYLIGPNILDVGTGAGLPGLPLALLFPQFNFVLLDSNRKKTRFLTHVVLTLGIKNVKIVSERVEKFSFACGFDTILSRATMSLKELVSKTKHLYASAGQLLAMKGKYPQDELDEITGVTEVHCLSDNPKRHVVQIKF